MINPVRKSVLEKIEDEKDLIDLEQAILENGDKKGTPLAEVMEEFYLFLS